MFTQFGRKTDGRESIMPSGPGTPLFSYYGPTLRGHKFPFLFPHHLRSQRQSSIPANQAGSDPARPGADALWAVRVGRSFRSSLFFSVFALHVAAFGPTESSREFREEPLAPVESFPCGAPHKISKVLDEGVPETLPF
jgi:hypothetical protein